MKFGFFIPQSRSMRLILAEAQDRRIESAIMAQLAGVEQHLRSGRTSKDQFLAVLGDEAMARFAANGWIELIILDEIRLVDAHGNCSAPMLRMDNAGTQRARSTRSTGGSSGILTLVPA